MRASHNGTLGVESSLTESFNSVHIDHFFKVVKIPDLDLLYLVRGTETVEEVKEGNAALDSCEVSDGAEVHNLLRICFSEHSETCLTASVDVGVIAEDVQRVRSDATG